MSNKKHIRGLGILAQIYRSSEVHCIVTFGPSVWLEISKKKGLKYYPKWRARTLFKEGYLRDGYYVSVTPKGIEALKEAGFISV